MHRSWYTNSFSFKSGHKGWSSVLQYRLWHFKLEITKSDKFLGKKEQVRKKPYVFWKVVMPKLVNIGNLDFYLLILYPWSYRNILGPIFLLKPRPLMILLEGFLVRPIISLTKNPSRNPFNVTWMSRKMGHYSTYWRNNKQCKSKIISIFIYFICSLLRGIE